MTFILNFSDLASVPVLAQLFQMGPPLLMIYLIWVLLRRCGRCGAYDAHSVYLEEYLKQKKEDEVDDTKSCRKDETEEGSSGAKDKNLSNVAFSIPTLSEIETDIDD